MSDHTLRFTIRQENSKFYATVNAVRLADVRPGHSIMFYIDKQDAPDLPNDADIYIRFMQDCKTKAPSDGCINDWKDGKKVLSTKHGTQGNTKKLAKGSYYYELRYCYKGDDYSILDPEIVIEGDPVLIKKHRRATKARKGPVKLKKPKKR